MGDPEISNFLLMILAWIVVIGVCLYGAVRCFLFEELFASLKILLVLPLWYIAHTLFGSVFQVIVNPNVAETHPFEYAVAPVYLAGAGLVCYFVIRHVRWLTVPPPGAPENNPHGSWFSEQNPAALKRKIAGVIFIGIATASVAAGFAISGTLFVIVGVSLIMDVQIWRS